MWLKESAKKRYPLLALVRTGICVCCVSKDQFLLELHIRML